MGRKGSTMPLSSATLHIEEAVEIFISYGQTEFHCKEVAELALLSPHSVNSILADKTKRGYLERVGPGRYKKVPGTKISVRLPASFIAIKTWPVIANSPEFLSTEAAAMEVESLAGRKDLELKERVGVDLSRWHKLGYLERRGKRGHYEYKIFPEFVGIERPPLE